MENKSYILQADGIVKRFGGLVALNSVSLHVLRGEVHALVGENGAGKSTMMNVIGGILPRDAGEIIFDNHPVCFNNPMEAIQEGIAIIHQELSLMPDLNIIENIFVGRMDSHMGRIQWARMAEKTEKLLAQIGLHIDPFKKICQLPASQRQMIEIVKAISIDAKLIVMDEPNSSLTETESQKLFSVIDTLKNKGVSIIYVSHKLEEVLKISDRITIYRDGGYVGTLEQKEATIPKIINMMVGRNIVVNSFPREPISDIELSVKNLTGACFRNISFDLRKGEILGFSGLVGSGRSEMARALFGSDKYESGEIYLRGNKVSFSSPKKAIESGLGMLSEDRKLQSIFPNLPIWQNLIISQLPYLANRGIINWKKVDETVDTYKNKFSIRMGANTLPISSLSGGNQQKVILSRWMAIHPKILILDEPTHGVDVGAKDDIYRFIYQLSQEGVSIIFISSEMPELIALCHRIVVMHEGCITGVLEYPDLTENKIMTLAAGYCCTE